MTAHFLDHIDTPTGRLALLVDDAGRLCAAGFVDRHERMARALVADAAPLDDPSGVTSRFRRYFAGELTALDDIEVAVRGTAFQEQVWAALREIPCGQTWSYGQLARHIGRPKAVRAVGAANGANPVSIVVPCHRVIGANGTMTGYGGGLDRKRWLLAHEGVALRG
mgnify:CR=1 FL=1